MREGVRGQKYFADAFTRAAFGDGLAEHARRKPGLHEFTVGDDAGGVIGDPRPVIRVPRSGRIGACASRRVAHAIRRAWSLRASPPRNRTMPIDRAGMLEAPVNGNPARPPRFQTKFFRARGVAADFKEVEILSGENVPVAIEKGAPEIFRQGLERAAIGSIVRKDRVVVDPRADKIVFAGIEQFWTLIAGGRNFIDPQRFYPGVADVSRIRRAGHVADAARHGAAIARGQELPLLEREMRQLIDADEQKFRALILVDIALIAAVAEARGRAVVPGDQVLRFVIRFVKLAWHIATEARQQRRF